MSMVSVHLSYLTISLIVLLYLSGFLLALSSVFQSRTPQGTMAWMLALIFIPFLAVPIFLCFGKKRLETYDIYEDELVEIRKSLEPALASFRSKKTPPLPGDPAHNFNEFLCGNELRLLIDGQETFREMLRQIELARRYVFLQMYIFRTDKIGGVFADALARKARAGVEVYVLYERLGIRMSKTVLGGMQAAGVFLGEFSPLRLNKLQINFRNHRKLLIVDGEVGFFGGINIGDDYLGEYPNIGYWRDTNVRIRGPIVNLAQIDFVKDWKFSQDKNITCNFAPPKSSGESRVVLLNSGPAEEKSHNLLQHIELFHSSRKRLWIANPYIVPPQGIIDALLIGCQRGIDLRIIVPANSDNPFVARAMEVYLERLVKAGVRVFKYAGGMLHQKVILIDDSLAVVGSSNLDFRSMYINFENAVITDDEEFLKDLDLVLRADMECSFELHSSTFTGQSFGEKLRSHLANSIAPIL